MGPANMKRYQFFNDNQLSGFHKKHSDLLKKNNTVPSYFDVIYLKN